MKFVDDDDDDDELAERPPRFRLKFTRCLKKNSFRHLTDR